MELKARAFFIKLLTKRLFMKSGGIRGIFLPLSATNNHLKNPATNNHLKNYFVKSGTIVSKSKKR